MSESKQQKQKLFRAIMDSLTVEQRNGIAEIIKAANIETEWHWNGEESVCEESTAATLDSLAMYFKTYDPASALE